MRKDIFIDNNITKNFANPLDPEYKKLIQWLMAFNPNDAGKNAYLIISSKLIAEYMRTSGSASSLTNITVIISKMTKEGRLVKISNDELKDFKRKYFKKKVVRNFTCNKEDQDHIPVVLLSDRKYALSLDDKFINDLINFPCFTVLTAKRPENLPYER
ncbi:MAG: hypothetical protein BWK80_54010 [Desulfobacteraceae bacterium IS3]|nr:MAG: hypothetical protein BWK80_54010 [Desulfobacteraceae bacterium IS3]